MKLFAGMMLAAGAMVAAGAANAQGLAPYAIESPYSAVSDFERPYAASPGFDAMRYAPSLLPPMEVYTIVRESGFSPLGIPQQRGFIYTISVINRDGDDGRLIIDSRTGRILRFMPAFRMSDNFNDEMTVSYGPVGPPPAVSDLRPSSPPVAARRVVSRTPLPVPRAMPRAAAAAKPLAAKPVSPPPQRSAAVQAKPDVVPVAAAPATVDAKPPAPPIQPTQDMPQAQGLD
jgi:hypothetical protein